MNTTDRKDARSNVRACRKLNGDVARSLHRAMAVVRAVQFELSDGPLYDSLGKAWGELDRAIELAGDTSMEIECLAITLAPKQRLDNPANREAVKRGLKVVES